MKKKMLYVMMIFCLVFTMIPGSAFAANSETPDFPDLPSGYSNWMKTNSYNSSVVIDELVTSAIEEAISKYLPNPINIVLTVLDIIEFATGSNEPIENLYYTNETYQAINSKGEFMKFEFRKFYADSARTQFVSSVQTEVTTGVRLTSEEGVVDA